MNRKQKIQAIRETGKTIKSIKIQFVESENGNDLIVINDLKKWQIDLIDAGTVKVEQDLSRLSDEMLRRIADGYKPEIYLINKELA